MGKKDRWEHRVRVAADSELRVGVCLIDNHALIPSPSFPWTLSFSYLVPRLPEEDWDETCQTIYVWGDCSFDVYGSNGSLSLSPYRFNQLVPQVMVGKVLSESSEDYTPSWSVQSGWVMQAQYFWQRDERPYAHCGPLIPVQEGELINTFISYSPNTGSIFLCIRSSDGKESTLEVSRPFPDQPGLFSSWKAFFQAAEDALTRSGPHRAANLAYSSSRVAPKYPSNSPSPLPVSKGTTIKGGKSGGHGGYVIRPNMNVESHYMSRVAVDSVCPWDVLFASLRLVDFSKEGDKRQFVGKSGGEKGEKGGGNVVADWAPNMWTGKWPREMDGPTLPLSLQFDGFRTGAWCCIWTYSLGCRYLLSVVPPTSALSPDEGEVVVVAVPKNHHPPSEGLDLLHGVEEEENLSQETFWGGANWVGDESLWQLLPLGNGSFSLINKSLGCRRALDVTSDSHKRLVMRWADKVTGQSWWLCPIYQLTKESENQSSPPYNNPHLFTNEIEVLMGEDTLNVPVGPEQSLVKEKKRKKKSTKYQHRKQHSTIIGYHLANDYTGREWAAVPSVSPPCRVYMLPHSQLPSSPPFPSKSHHASPPHSSSLPSVAVWSIASVSAIEQPRDQSALESLGCPDFLARTDWTHNWFQFCVSIVSDAIQRVLWKLDELELAMDGMIGRRSASRFLFFVVVLLFFLWWYTIVR